MGRTLSINDPSFHRSFQRGEEAAFDALFREYHASLTYYASRFLSNEKTSEDIVQDCFVILWQRRDKMENITAIKSYLYTVVRNQCLKALKRPHKLYVASADDVYTAPIEEDLIAAEIARELHKQIATLSPALQKVIQLYYIEGKSNREIARDLEIEPDTVTRQRLRALVALRKTKISL